MNHFLVLAVGALVDIHADEAPRGPEFGKASPFGLLIVVLLLISVVFLVRSMNRHLKKLPESFDRDNPVPDQAVDDGTVGVDKIDDEPPGKTPDDAPDNGAARRDGSRYEPDS